MITKEWMNVVLTRAIKTMAQTALGMMSVGAAISEVEWKQVLSVSIVAAVYSVLTSIVSSERRDGELVIDSASKNTDGDLVIKPFEDEETGEVHEDKVIFSLDFDDVAALRDKQVATLRIKNDD